MLIGVRSTASLPVYDVWLVCARVRRIECDLMVDGNPTVVPLISFKRSIRDLAFFLIVNSMTRTCQGEKRTTTGRTGVCASIIGPFGQLGQMNHYSLISSLSLLEVVCGLFVVKPKISSLLKQQALRKWNHNFAIPCIVTYYTRRNKKLNKQRQNVWPIWENKIESDVTNKADDMTLCYTVHVSFIVFFCNNSTLLLFLLFGRWKKKNK